VEFNTIGERVPLIANLKPHGKVREGVREGRRREGGREEKKVEGGRRE